MGFSNGLSIGMLRQALILGIGGALLTGIVVVYANISATDVGSGNEEIALAVNTFVDDTTVVMDNNNIIIVTAASAAAGDSAPGVEANTSAYPAVNNALVIDNYAYSIDIHESANADWQTSDTFRIRVYGYNSTGPASTLLTTLYIDQSTANDAAIEGVSATIDLGFTTAIYDHFDIIVDRQ